MERSPRFSPNAGIAIGPILFVLAMLALLGSVFAAGGSDFQVAAKADRISADISTQANLIRSTINACNIQYQMQLAANAVLPAASDADGVPGGYPVSTDDGTLVSALLCDPAGGESLWNNTTSNILLPQPTRNFAAWTYVNGGTKHGRCIWTQPTSSSPKTDVGITTGLTRASAKFNTATAVTLGKEAVYNINSDSQKFVVWITGPETVSDADSHCVP